MKTAKDLELSLLLKEKTIQDLKKEYMILQNASDEVEEEKDKEIERLNNIINELEKRLNKLRVELKSLYVGEWGDTEDEAEEKINYIEFGEDDEN